MKKTVLAFLSAAAVLVLTACSGAQTQNAAQETTAAEISESEVSEAEASEAEAPESGSGETEDMAETGAANLAEAETVGASDEATEQAAENTDSKTLIVYFSRWGNTEYPDDVDATTSASIVADQETFGTTEYVARMIQERVGGDLHLIQTQEPYPTDFDELRDQNHEEMDAGYLPALTESDLDLSRYDTVFIGYPIWATDVPQAVLSFLNEYDLSGKTVIPFCTHDGYGAGSSYSTIAQACPGASMLDGIAIEASDVPTAQESIADWLRELGYEETENSSAAESTQALTITIGDTVLEGVLYDTELAQEIQAHLPLTVSMVGYGGREYYGGIDFTPEHTEGGQLYFENGDITYCSANNTMAIFYAQTDRPNLTMEVIPIGKVTSDLAVFDTMESREDITFSLAE
ncbi:MAG: cyclophilin-like fold protein [Eubacteriales bacterium]|nr:cyclophilin-like fold protein [Eubacteriales bacterium]